jgi:exosortase/archaeosortase
MTQQQVSQVRTTRREPGQEQRLYTFKAMQLIWLGLAVLEVLIGLRILFKLIAVNPDNTLASLLYGLTSLFLFPFAGLTPAPSAGGMVLEISSLIAMVVYALLGWAAVRLVEVIFYRPRGTSVDVIESTSSEQHTQ